MREIGGYFEMENLKGEEYYPELLPMNLGRTALLYLLRLRKADSVYLPYFLCDSVIDACKRHNYGIRFYHTDENMRPVGLTSLREAEYLYLVNYYGQLTDEQILEMKEKYGRVIVDHVHGFFQKPLKGVDTLYSCRKFFGLSDGAYLSTELEPTIKLDTDYSASRLTHILGRYEKDGSTYYQQMLDNAAHYHEEEPKWMSELTHNLLRGIDYEGIRKQRQSNFNTLDSLLGEANGRQFLNPEGPLCYPFYMKNGMAMRKKLAEKKIYVPTYWNNVLKDCAQETAEYDCAANILALPCDQRYGKQEMQIVAEEVLRLWKYEK
ncbi:MAG: hypothetical protein PHC41_08890 [Lachnospiraceae bacterium]|nr:hypothetical protein [Lachnospiraceae bacterium]MDD3616324.1 hypothetical protein [Lachnospiraceae bacterium]